MKMIVDFAAKLNVSKQNLYKYENDIIINAVTGEFYAVTNRYE